MTGIRIVFSGLIILLGIILFIIMPSLVMHGEHDAIFIVLLVLVGLCYSLKKLFK